MFQRLFISKDCSSHFIFFLNNLKWKTDESDYYVMRVSENIVQQNYEEFLCTSRLSEGNETRHKPIESIQQIIKHNFCFFETGLHILSLGKFIDAQSLEIQGGGSLGFLANYFEGGTWGCEKISGGGGSFLLHFYVEVFKNLYRGYMRCPPTSPPLPPPVCIYVGNTNIQNCHFQNKITILLGSTIF